MVLWQFYLRNHQLSLILHKIPLIKHAIINRQVSNPVFYRDFPLIVQYYGFLDMVVRRVHEIVEGTMNGVVLSRFYFDGQHSQMLVVVNQIVHFALLLVVVVMQRKTVGVKLLRHHSFIHRAKVNAPLVS